MCSANLRRKKVCEQSRTPSQVMSPCSGGAACSSPAVKRYLSRGMESRQGQQIGQRAPSFPPSPNSAVFFSSLSSKSSSLSPLYKLSDLMAEAAAPLLVHGFPPSLHPPSRRLDLQMGSTFQRLPWWLTWHGICLQCRKPRFDPWVGKIPWGGEGLPTPVFLPGEFHGQRSLLGCSPWGLRIGHD